MILAEMLGEAGTILEQQMALMMLKVEVAIGMTYPVPWSLLQWRPILGEESNDFVLDLGKKY